MHKIGKMKGNIFMYTGLWNKIKVSLPVDCNQRDDVHLGDGAWEGAPEAGTHPVSGLA